MALTGERAAVRDPAPSIARALVAFVAYFGLATGLATAFARFGEPGTPARLEWTALAMALAAAAIVAGAVVAPVGVRGWRRGVLPRAAALYALFLVAWVPFTFWVYPRLLAACGVAFPPQPQLAYFVGDAASSWGRWVVTGLACLLAPLAEEVLYRGYLQEAAKRIAPRWLAVAGVAAVFGLTHGAIYALPVGLLGLLFGYVRERFDCLEAPVFVHALHNSLTVAVTVAFPATLEVYR